MIEKSGKIKSIFFIAMLIGLAFLPGIQTAVSNENEKDENGAVNINILSHIEENIVISFDINTFQMETINLDEIIYYRYILPGESNSLNAGFPDLPHIRRSIVIPNDKEMSVREIGTDYYVVDDVKIIPSKGNLLRTVNPDDVPYQFDDVYTQDRWYPSTFVELDDPYIIRDIRGQVVQINPIQYNPVQQQVRILNRIEIEVLSVGIGGKNMIETSKDLSRIDYEFDKIYSSHFINYEEVLSDLKYTPVSDRGNMLVITYDDFYNEMIPFVNWKNMKGIPTEIINISDVGSTATDVDAYIENYYTSNGLTFVLLVGDIAQIPSLSANGGASDPSYSYITDDHYPDLFVGRFSAETIDHVQTQVERTLTYEKYPDPSGQWYTKGIGIASDDPGSNPDDGEYDWEHLRNIRDDLLYFTYTLVDELYEGSQGGEDASGNPSSSDVAASVNDGRGIINYCGHGSTTSWSTSGFSNTGVNALVNDNMLPFIWAVACVNGNFNGNTCFAESWLRATNDDQPTGAIAMFASSVNQAWAPPMRAQDEMNDILVEIYEDNIKRSFGGISFNGCMNMNDVYGSAGYDETDNWHVFGDPSFEVRTDTPEDMTIFHDDFIFTGVNEFEVTVNGLKDALCAISHNGILLGSAYTDATGEAISVLDVAPPLRNIAEFEPMQGVLINYGARDAFGISLDIIAEMSEDVIIYTIVDSTSQQATVESLFDTGGVHSDNREYIIAPSDDYWTRDFLNTIDNDQTMITYQTCLQTSMD